MRDSPLIQNLHAAISRLDWHAVEAAANAIRDDEHSARRVLAGTDIGGLPHDWSTAQVAEERMKELSTLKAGIRRLSDEEELINETERDGMLTVVHISARLADAEKERDRVEEEVKRLNNALSAAEVERDELRAALEKCQKALASMVDPSCIAQSTVLNAFSMATEAEAAARAAIKGDS